MPAREVARQELQAAELDIELQFQMVRRELSKALYRAALAEQVVEIGRNDLAQVNLWGANAEQRYTAGTGSQVEVLRLKNESARRVQDLKTRENELTHEHLTINRLINRPTGTPVPRFALPPAAPPIPYGDPLIQQALRAEPRLQVMLQEVRAAEARTELARRQRLPDITLGIDGRQYSRDPSPREGMFTVAMNLPWFNRGKYRSDVDREIERGESARLESLDYELSVREDLHILSIRIDAARREALAYSEDIIPRSEQALQVASVSWMSNRGMFTDMMESRRMLLEARLMEARAVADQYEMISDLLLRCGLVDPESLTRGLPSDPGLTHPTPHPQPPR